MTDPSLFALLHVCDGLFPIGGFAHSDGLEAAVDARRVRDGADLRAWLDVCLSDTLGRLEGPGVWGAWRAATSHEWDALAILDAELDALRPSVTARQASRAMGARLLRTWHQLRPHPMLALLAETNRLPARTLPVAFGIVTAVSGIDARSAIDGFVYTRVSAIVSAAMRLLPVGQHEAHALLARVLADAPRVIDALMARDEPPASFAPALDVAAMSHPYVHSTLFLS